MRVISDAVLSKHHERPIQFDLFIPDKCIGDLVVFCHGFKGFKDWGPWQLMAEFIAKRGIPFVKFNLSHNGVSPDSPDEFSDETGFRLNTTSIELDDIACLLDHMFKEYSESLPNGRYKFIGHSRGGPLGILQSLRDQRMSALCTWNSVGDLREWLRKHDESEWRNKGYVVIKNARTGQELQMGYEYFLDLDNHPSALEAASEVFIPWLIVHAESDETVPVQVAKDLKKASSNAQLLIIAQSGHTFGGIHPWESHDLPDALERALFSSLEL